MVETRRKAITVDGLAHGDNPIPIASRSGPLVATSGIAGLDRKTGKLPEPLEEQVAHMFANLQAVMEAAGASCDDIVKVTIFVRTPEVRQPINDEWKKMFPDANSRPARHILNYDLSHGMLVQCEAIAMVNGD